MMFAKRDFVVSKISRSKIYSICSTHHCTYCHMCICIIMYMYICTYCHMCICVYVYMYILYIMIYMATMEITVIYISFHTLTWGSTPCGLLQIYSCLIHSVPEYCYSVWHSSLSVHLSDKIEKVQKRALCTIYPVLRYPEALLTSGFTELCTRRDHLCSKTFEMIKRQQSCLNHLVPLTCACAHTVAEVYDSVTDHQFLNVEKNDLKRAISLPCVSKLTGLG